MSEAEENEEDTVKKGGKGGMILALLLLVAGAGAGFAGQRMGLASGLLGGSEAEQSESEYVTLAEKHPPSEPGAFIPLEPLIVSLAGPDEHRHLRFVVTLEVDPHAVEEVNHVMPRIMDVMNSYLRAIEVSDLEERHILTMLREHLFTRLQLVLGVGRLRNILVQEFVLN